MHEEEIWRGLAARIKLWGKELGFSAVGIAGVDLGDAEAGLDAWLHAGFHGGMDYMAAHGARRARPAELLPGTRSVHTIGMRFDLDVAFRASRYGKGEGEDYLNLPLDRDQYRAFVAALIRRDCAARLADFFAL